MKNSIEVGDVVQPIAGGPLLTVERLLIEGRANRAICIKSTPISSISKIELPVETLKKFDPRFLQLSPAFF
jgi:phenylacetate-coenzyme A ligase PaaK-like adenylate-forming protein